MIAELLMEVLGFDAVWHVEACSPENCMWRAARSGHGGRIPRHRRWPFGWMWGTGGLYVGTWTGPHHDLLCVRSAETREQAEAYLSPPGRTILTATLKASVKWWATRPATASEMRKADFASRFGAQA